MKRNGAVAKGLLMITQIGISMIVPIFLGAFLGYWLDRWLKTSFLFLLFLFFGILAAFRNIYKLTKPFYAEDLKREQAEWEYWNSLKKKSGVAEETSLPPVSGTELRRRRAQLSEEQRAQAGDVVFKSRRETAEEEFAAWRREREKDHDGACSGGEGNEDRK